MKKLCMFIALFLLLCAKASAEWQSVPVDSIERAFFVENSTIKKSQNLLKLWILTNYSSPQQVGNDPAYLSEKYFYEIDCRENKLRMVQGALYKNINGGGSIIHTENRAGEWSFVVPGSTYEVVISYICKNM
ncbi:surface-adhesin E family protein [Pseudomonas vranovensis]|uniref:surface-adhesin E family protein n=1 Tax=Pseudomonas vranovensis TaxID=321661 RepID=UPI0012EB07A5|nr:surface-adhesin E family protein [Pseudomonas vranovensis]